MAETSNSKSESFADSIKLHEADMPWKPSFKVQASTDSSHALSTEEKIKRSSLSILNKLTPQKFEILLKQLQKLDIDTKTKLDIIVNLIYEKAINEPLYSVPYANMCKHLAMIKVPIENEKSVNFRNLLLTKCQREFEQDRSYEKRLEKLKTEEEITSDKKSVLEGETYEEKITRHRRLGSIRFIGELFKLSMLIEPIIHEIIKKFLSQGDEESLECLCRLLTTVGKELEETKNKNSRERMDSYFAEIQKIVDKRLTSTRIRFLLQDVIDLRKNNWVPRRIENSPRTIEEIHREAAREAQEQEQAFDNYRRNKGVELTLQGAELSEEEVKTKSKHLIEEFLENNNSELAARFVREMFSSSTINVFIKSTIHQVLERSSQARNSVGQLLFLLVKQKIVTDEQYKNGFACILKFGDDIEFDIPFVWKYTAELLQPMVEDSMYSLPFLKDVLQPCIPSDIAGKTVSVILHCLTEKKGRFQVKKLWEESDLKWTDFLSNANVDEFVRAHSLEFTISPPVDTGSAALSAEKIKSHLLRLLSSEENEEICHWIETSIPEKGELDFIRTIVSAVIENAIKDSGAEYQLDLAKLKKRIPILTRYIDHKENLELQALYAIQSFINQLNQPKGVLCQIFEILYDEDVITKEGFNNWERSDDADNADGKEIALHYVKSFLAWLNEKDSG